MRVEYSWQLIGFGKYKRVETEIKEPRPSGFYWVHYEGRWQIAEWDKDQWILLNDIGLMNDEHFSIIHEERIEEPPYDEKP